MMRTSLLLGLLFSLCCACQKDQLALQLADACSAEALSTALLAADYTDEAGEVHCLLVTELGLAGTELQAPFYNRDFSTQIDPYRKMYLRIGLPLAGAENQAYINSGLSILIRNTALDPPSGPVNAPSVPEVFLTPELILDRLLFPGGGTAQRDIRLDLGFENFSGYVYDGPETAPFPGRIDITSAQLIALTDGTRAFELEVVLDQLELRQWYIQDQRVQLTNGRGRFQVPVAAFLPE